MFDRSILVLSVCLLVSACGTPQKNNLNTIAAAPPGSGTVATVEAPLDLATDAVIFAVEESGYEIKRTDRPADRTNRVLMVHGITLTSWGEVGRAVITPLNPGQTNVEFFVRQRHDIEEWPNKELQELEGWQSSIDEFLQAVRAGLRMTGPLRVADRKIAQIDADEQTGERALIGVLSGGFFGAAIASDGVEDDIDFRQPYQYVMTGPDGGEETLLSFSLLEAGDCVRRFTGQQGEGEAGTPDETSIVYLVKRPPSACAIGAPGA